MIRAGIVGATGYVGSELLRLLAAHPDAEAAAVTSQSYAGKRYGEVFESFRHREDLMLITENIEEMAERCDVIFIALPHGVASQKITPAILKRCKIIDMGADFRLKDWRDYERWYETEHHAKALLDDAVYGLCEINREKIKEAVLVANPGCYTTCSILCLYPLVKEGLVALSSLIIDAKSGVTGAGRGVSLATHFDETNESVKAYKVASHRHTPEIEEQLGLTAGQDITLTFTPHLMPMNRGILATCYATLKEKCTYEDIQSVYSRYYGGEHFVRLTKKGVFPETKWVKASNYCDIGFGLDERTNRIVVVGALDNLMKGAAGQAVQNMNLLFGLDEKAGLDSMPVFPA